MGSEEKLKGQMPKSKQMPNDKAQGTVAYPPVFELGILNLPRPLGFVWFLSLGSLSLL
jgi:hypothetical protein